MIIIGIALRMKVLLKLSDLKLDYRRYLIMNIAETIVKKANGDTNSVMELSNKHAVDREQDFAQEKTYYFFVDNSGIVIHNDLVETF
tara:strand:+ start:172 stop:432 length:261 start_codon:yes stop_codon:yes gene_type:complete